LFPFQLFNCSRSFAGPLASPLPLALAGCCYNNIAQHPAGALARNHWSTARKTSQLAVTQPLVLGRPAGPQSPGRQHREDWPACSQSAAEASLLQPELSDAPCLRNTALFRAHKTSPVTAYSACLPACSSVYSVNRKTFVVVYMAVPLSIDIPQVKETMYGFDVMYGNRSSKNMQLLLRYFYTECKLTWWPCVNVFSFQFDGDNYRTTGAGHVKPAMEIDHNIYIIRETCL
jgi:hypothetical protein